MKHIFLLILISAGLLAQTTKDEIKLIVRADDIGFSHAVNNACIKVFREGIATSVEVIVPSPWFMEAVKLLKENPGYDVGVHLCLTSEWTNLKWRPMTNSPSLMNNDGYFFPFIWPNDLYPKNQNNFLLENNPKPEEVEAEFRRQIEIAKKYIPNISHLDGHMGCTGANEQIKAIAQKLSKEYGLPLDFPAEAKSLEWSAYNGIGAAKTEEDFISKLKELKPGIYYVIEHPGLDNDEMQAIYTKQGDEVAKSRQQVTNVWTSENVKKVIRDRKIKLISVKQAFGTK